jgi:cation:H+ antiporter
MLIGIYLLAGLVALYLGAEWLVRGSVSLARRFGLPPLLIGLTIVAYGTSAPELLVSVLAGFRGQGGLALGNAVGSCIFNAGFIVGVTALIVPIRVEMQLVKQDAPIMVLAAGAFLLIFLDGRVDRWEAWVLLGGLFFYTGVHVKAAVWENAKAEREPVESDTGVAQVSPVKEAALILGGCAALAVGSHWFVEGAVALARFWGVSEAVVGLSVVAAGTGLPELAASVVAACRKQPDIAIGNVVGSNIYNILGVVGLAGVLTGPLDGQGMGQTEVQLMAATSLILLALAWTGFLLKRWEAVILLAAYGLYIAQLWPW